MHGEADQSFGGCTGSSEGGRGAEGGGGGSEPRGAALSEDAYEASVRRPLLEAPGCCQPDLQHLEPDEGPGLLQSRDSGPEHGRPGAPPLGRPDRRETREDPAAPREPGALRVLGLVPGSGFDSGTLSWEVQVGDNTDWELGVLAESVCRTGFTGSTAWSVGFGGAGYRAFSPWRNTRSSESLRSCRTSESSWERGALTFCDPDTHTHTHTFTERLRPYLRTRNAVPLKIRPVKVSEVVQGERGQEEALKS